MKKPDSLAQNFNLPKLATSFWQSFDLRARLLLTLNAVLILALLLLSLPLVRLDKLQGRHGQAPPAISIQEYMSQRSEIVFNLLAVELEETQRDTKFLADLASHIFSYPQSYRLAAQPGEYAYDEVNGLYVSVRNDDTSVALLSAAMPLTPNIIRDIRLSEYLNPVFKSITALKPSYQGISLYTSDSLIRGFPWFNVRQKITDGSIEPDFKALDFVFFYDAGPEKNPLKNPIWSLMPSKLTGSGFRAICSAPFHTTDRFKGVITIELNLQKTASRIFQKVDSQNEFCFFLGDQKQILGMNKTLELALKNGLSRSLPLSLQELQFQDSAEIERALQELPRSGAHFQQTAGFYIRTLPVSVLPVRLVTLVAEAQAGRLGLASPALLTSQTRHRVFFALVAVLVLILFNSIWIYKTQGRVQSSSNQLAESFAVLAGLDLESALIRSRRRPFGNLSKTMDNSVQTLQRTVNSPQDRAVLPALNVRAVSEATTELEIFSQRLRVLYCFEAGEAMESSFSKLVTVLSEIFSVDRVWFMFYSPDAKLFRSHSIGHGLSRQELNRLSVGIRDGGILEKILTTRRAFYAASPSFFHSDLEVLSGLISQNILIGPLIDREKVFGFVMLADKKGDFDVDDQDRFQALQEAISKTTKNLLQNEGFRAIDSIRREYCLELTKEVELPLNRIRCEVESIYSRLDKLNPYYKKHCETILFELGKLYQIAREASELEREPLELLPKPCLH